MLIFFKVNSLQKQGTWSNDAADLLPGVLTDWTARTVMIYSKDIYKSQHEFSQDNPCPELPLIPLGFIAYDHNHYDACF